LILSASIDNLHLDIRFPDGDSFQRFKQRILAAFSLATIVGAPMSSESLEIDGHEQRRPLAPRYAVALTEALGTNVFFNAFDRFVLREDYAQTSLSTMETNLESPWVFDEDGFMVNEIGHPYHGSLYFAACRSSGLGFWASALGTGLGSATWELFGEVERPSINDLASTTLGGMVLGEIFHRLYAECLQSRTPLRFAVSPMDALNEALFHPDNEFDGEVSRYTLSLEAGIAFPRFELSEERNGATGTFNPTAFVYEGLGYGDPFCAAGAKPFSRFEQRLRLGLSPDFYEVSFFADGILASWPVVDRRSRKLSLGASLHYDIVYSSLAKLSANAIGLSAAAARLYRSDLSVSSEFFLNAVAMSTNDNVFLANDGIDDLSRDYDFGVGEGFKARIRVEHPSLGMLGVTYDYYGLNVIPDSLTEDSSFVYALVGMLEVSFERKVSPRAGIGIAYRLYHKDAFYADVPDVHESQGFATIYARLL